MSFTSSKKRKHDPAARESKESTKKTKPNEIARTEGKTNAKKDKGKSRADGEFTVVHSTVRLAIAPVFAGNPKAGAEEMLDSMIMRYIPAFQGVVLAHSNLRFLHPTGKIISDCPYLLCDIGFEATVWSPRVGLKLTGKINLCSPDHISLLVHRTFNVSIPRYHIPTDEWEFEYGPAENDPEFGPDAVKDDAEEPVDKTSGEHESMPGGKWVHKITGDTLGGLEGHLEFTVIGLTVANEMLSLLGSIQFDPFSPEHVPLPAAVPQAATSEGESIPTAVEHSSIGNHDEDSEDDDHSQRLRKTTKGAVRKRKAQETAEKGKKKKRKVKTK